ncbi:MAG: MotA/TolQ/ExbB proton channel family protein [Isosphaeraceae bacterium]
MDTAVSQGRREPGRRPARRFGRSAAVGLTLALLASSPLPARADAPAGGLDVEVVKKQARRAAAQAAAWYERTPASDRMAWGGLAASALLGLGVVLERSARLRRKRIIPNDFRSRFLDRMEDGRLDRGKALDFCELNASPASRVALAAVKRWGRPAADIERAVSLTQRVEAEKLRRHVGTLRRIAALAPMIGLLGTLLSISRALAGLGATSGPGAWGPALANALGPLTAGVAIATLALVAFDGLTGKAEAIAAELDRIGATTVDAVAMALPPEPRPTAVPHPSSPGVGSHSQTHAHLPAPPRAPHPIRLEVLSPR